MKQVLQNLGTGATEIIETPCPSISKNEVLIKTFKTLISTGTEKMALSEGGSSLIKKAISQPEKVKKAIDLFKNEGLKKTLKAIDKAQDNSIPMGYSNVGEIIAVGANVSEFKIGDRVLSNGAHSEVVAVSKNLCALVPENVTNEQAVYTVLGAIALQGVRLAKPSLGESFVVTGLGIIGLLTIQILKANGCRVLGLDFDKDRLTLAEKFGATTYDLSEPHLLKFAEKWSHSQGVDGVIITAATNSNDPVHQGAQMCRKRGRIILTGVTGLELNRNDFYTKELSFQVSCSYGPGRYDDLYEKQGVDYPLGFVRWTQQRNFQAILNLMAEEKIKTKDIQTHDFEFSHIKDAYQLINSEQKSLGVTLDYKNTKDNFKKSIAEVVPFINTAQKTKTAVIGVGNYAQDMLLPYFSEYSQITHLSSHSGLSGTVSAKKYNIPFSTTDNEEIFNDNTVNTVVIATRHNTHAQLCLKALKSGKNVFVEKPLVINEIELKQIENYCKDNPNHPQIMIGFNRRFSPHILKATELIKPNESPININMCINAGNIPQDHWTQNLDVGGGRLMGEACHFVDLARFLSDSPIADSYIQSLDSKEQNSKENFSILLKFENGSHANIQYWSNGSKSIPKERIEIYDNGKVIEIDDYKKMKLHGYPSFSGKKIWEQDKGQSHCIQAFIDSLENNKPNLIPLDEILEVHRVCLELNTQI